MTSYSFYLPCVQLFVTAREVLSGATAAVLVFLPGPVLDISTMILESLRPESSSSRVSVDNIIPFRAFVISRATFSSRILCKDFARSCLSALLEIVCIIINGAREQREGNLQ